MPILSGRLGEVVDPGDEPDGELRIYREPDVGTISATWIDPDNVQWPLSNTAEEQGWFTRNGPSGWGSTPVEIVADDNPRGGELPRYIRTKPRRLMWPLYIFGATHQIFTDNDRLISGAFAKTTARMRPGQLVVARPNGTRRLVQAYYEDGLGGESEQGHLNASPVVQLYCPEGFWLADREVVVGKEFVSSPDETASFYAPFMSLTSSRGVPSSGSGEGGGEGGDDESVTEIVNPGDVTAWPVWTITGPMSVMVAENLTLGTRFRLTYPLAAEQKIVVTTERGAVRGPGDEVLSKYIDWFDPGGAELWPLQPGVNRVRFAVDGAATGSAVQMAYVPRFDRW